jgi:hypothetical protein
MKIMLNLSVMNVLTMATSHSLCVTIAIVNYVYLIEENVDVTAQYSSFIEI